MTWATASELNNLRFEIYRNIPNGAARKIGTVAGNGTTYQLKKYKFEDRDVKSGQTYTYLLKQIDTNGSWKDIAQKSVIFSSNSVEIGYFYPNPATNKVYLSLEALQPMELRFQFSDQLGRELMSIKKSVKPALNRLEFSIENLKPGIYTVKIHIQNANPVIRTLQVN